MSSSKKGTFKGSGLLTKGQRSSQKLCKKTLGTKMIERKYEMEHKFNLIQGTHSFVDRISWMRPITIDPKWILDKVWSPPPVSTFDSDGSMRMSRLSGQNRNISGVSLFESLTTGMVSLLYKPWAEVFCRNDSCSFLRLTSRNLNGLPYKLSALACRRWTSKINDCLSCLLLTCHLINYTNPKPL